MVRKWPRWIRSDLLLHFAIEKALQSCKMQHGYRFKRWGRNYVELFGSYFQTLEFSEQSAGVYP